MFVMSRPFPQPMLEVLYAAGGRVNKQATRRLDRTMRWNFAGVLVTVGSSTVLYANLIVYSALSFARRYSLNSSNYGNPFSFGLSVDTVLNTFGMLLLCGIFKDASVSRMVPAHMFSIIHTSRLSVQPSDQTSGGIPNFMSEGNSALSSRAAVPVE
jgi:hypothetical protein